MLDRIKTGRLSFLGTLLFVVSGCGSPNAEYALNTRTHELIPNAQKAVKEKLLERFGTPHELIAWDRFPINYSEAKGTVASIEETAGTFTATIENLNDSKITPQSPILWTSGARSEAKEVSDTVESFNTKTGELRWIGTHNPKPKVGDSFIIGLGDTLRLGRAVYMKNCMHCHGVAGDGNGPTSQYLNPKPRDYRLGLFKFTSTLSAEKATRDDLHRIVKYGIPGTYMPSFLLLGATETESIVEYVRWLAIRGEFEKRLIDDLGDFSSVAIDSAHQKTQQSYEAAKKSGEKPERPATLSAIKKAAADSFDQYLKEDMETSLEDTATFLAEAWTRAEEESSLITPSSPRVANDAASRERGRLLYMSDKTKCYTCHGFLGKGDGVATEDFWKKPGSDEVYPRRGLHDAWGNPLAPRNLTLGQYRGGRRPIDIFRRIYAGIKGTPMPGFGKTALKDDEIWDIVNYVMSLQYQKAQHSKATTEDHSHSKTH